MIKKNIKITQFGLYGTGEKGKGVALIWVRFHLRMFYHLGKATQQPIHTVNYDANKRISEKTNVCTCWDYVFQMSVPVCMSCKSRKEHRYTSLQIKKKASSLPSTLCLPRRAASSHLILAQKLQSNRSASSPMPAQGCHYLGSRRREYLCVWALAARWE